MHHAVICNHSPPSTAGSEKMWQVFTFASYPLCRLSAGILFLCQNNGDYSSVGFVTAMPGHIGKWLPHDRRANINPYPPDRFADESSYPHDRHADKAYSPHSCNIQCLILSLQIKDVLCSNPAPCIFFTFCMFFFFFQHSY